MVAEDGNFYFRKTSLGTGFSACNCLFDSRNCLLTSLKLGSYYKLNWPKRAPAVYWLLGTLLYPCSEALEHGHLVGEEALAVQLLLTSPESPALRQQRVFLPSLLYLMCTILFRSTNAG